MTLSGTVQDGVVVLDNGHELAEGTRVEVLVPEPLKPASPLGDALLRHAGKAVGLPEDCARQHDHYLHGTPKR